MKIKTQKGFTLIEMVIYIAFFVILIGGVFGVVFQTIDSVERIENKIIIEQEANFIMRKISNLMISASSLVVPTNDMLTIHSYSGGSTSFKIENESLKIFDSGEWKILNNQNIRIKPVEGGAIFAKQSGGGREWLELNFEIEVKDAFTKSDTFRLVRYLRK